MSIKGFIFFALWFILPFSVHGQSAAIIGLSPTSLPSSLYYVTSPAIPGVKPNEPLSDYTGQSLTYTWKSGLGHKAQIYVYAASIPVGISVSIEADVYSGPGGINGIASTPITLNSTNQSTHFLLISEIGNVKSIKRTIKQSILISDIRSLYPIVNLGPINVYFEIIGN